MDIVTLPVNRESLTEYSTVSIGFEVQKKYAVMQVEDGLGFNLLEQEVKPSYFMDYDIVDGEGPTRWLKRFDTTAWRLFLAYENQTVVGGATVAVSTPNLFMLDEREDLAVLWDIRVRSESRRSGIGTNLLDRVVQWSKDRGYCQLKIETQNINVPACKFYAKQGCTLSGINFYRYTNNPTTRDQVMLLWYLEL